MKRGEKKRTNLPSTPSPASASQPTTSSSTLVRSNSYPTSHSAHSQPIPSIIVFLSLISVLGLLLYVVLRWVVLLRNQWWRRRRHTMSLGSILGFLVVVVFVVCRWLELMLMLKVCDEETWGWFVSKRWGWGRGSRFVEKSGAFGSVGEVIMLWVRRSVGWVWRVWVEWCGRGMDCAVRVLFCSLSFCVAVCRGVQSVWMHKSVSRWCEACAEGWNTVADKEGRCISLFGNSIALNNTAIFEMSTKSTASHILTIAQARKKTALTSHRHDHHHHQIHLSNFNLHLHEIIPLSKINTTRAQIIIWSPKSQKMVRHPTIYKPQSLSNLQYSILFLPLTVQMPYKNKFNKALYQTLVS